MSEKRLLTEDDDAVITLSCFIEGVRNIPDEDLQILIDFIKTVGEDDLDDLR